MRDNYIIGKYTLAKMVGNYIVAMATQDDHRLSLYPDTAMWLLNYYVYWTHNDATTIHLLRFQGGDVYNRVDLV